MHSYYNRKKQPTLFSFIYDEIFLRSWWTIVFLIICFVGYERLTHVQYEEYSRLENKLAALTEERKQLLLYQNNLQRQISSFNDYAWVELTLMKVLGMAPEGQIKVFFAQKEQPSEDHHP